MSIEIWKVIEDASKYEISNLGRVRNIKTKKLINSYNMKGYPAVTLRTEDLFNKRKSNHLIHRLVAKAFILNPNKYPNVNHIDGNRENYNINNLEWCTQKQNINHSKTISKNGAVISRQKILKINNDYPDLTKEELLKMIVNNCK